MYGRGGDGALDPCREVGDGAPAEGVISHGMTKPWCCSFSRPNTHRSDLSRMLAFLRPPSPIRFPCPDPVASLPTNLILPRDRFSMTLGFEKKGKPERSWLKSGTNQGLAASGENAAMALREAFAEISMRRFAEVEVEAVGNIPLGWTKMSQCPDRHARRCG